MTRKQELTLSAAAFLLGIVCNVPPLTFLGGLGIAYCAMAYFLEGE